MQLFFQKKSLDFFLKRFFQKKLLDTVFEFLKSTYYTFISKKKSLNFDVFGQKLQVTR